jgi:ribonuclease J
MENNEQNENKQNENEQTKPVLTSEPLKGPSDNNNSDDNRSRNNNNRNRNNNNKNNTNKPGNNNRPNNAGKPGTGKPNGGNRRSYNNNRSFSAKRPISNYGQGKSEAPLPDGVHLNIKDAIDANKQMHADRLYPFSNLGNPDASVKITPLGGLEQIGGNMAIVETENHAIIIDVGMSFPDESMHGVDILVPDFSYLRQIKHKIIAVIITHAHEDHIGAMPYLFKEMQFPIYGTPLPLGLIANKFDEHKLTKAKELFRFIEKRKKIQIGDFQVEWIHVTHSIVDSSSVAITTDAGTIIHTGDFKFDTTPVDGYAADYARYSEYGDKGVLCVFSDSTNSHNPGSTESEAIIRPTFERLFKEATGRIIMSTFSSNVHRVLTAIETGLKHGRKICVIGRSMEKNLQTCLDLDYINIPVKMFVEPHEVSKLPESEVLIVTTGSQGEPMSALFRMSIGEHRHVKLRPTDTIILSSKAIPGNEPSVSQVVNNLTKLGAHVVHYGVSNLHTSGHAAQEEQKLMLRLLKPKFFLPIHGEYQHRAKHMESAIKCGIDRRNCMLINDGDTIDISVRGLKKLKTVRTGTTFVDNQMNRTIDNSIIFDRQNLANDGIVMLVAQVSIQDHEIIGRPKVTTYGLVPDRQERKFSEELEDILQKFVTHIRPGDLQNTRNVENNLRQVLKKHIYRSLKKNPIIVPTVFAQ